MERNGSSSQDPKPLTENDVITVLEAYKAMIAFLTKENEICPSDELGGLLGSISMDIWADGKPNDPAAWNDWLSAVNSVLTENERR